jgi:hypothetical protein
MRERNLVAFNWNNLLVHTAFSDPHTHKTTPLVINLQLDTVLFIVCKGRREQKMERWRNGGCLGVQ